MSCHAPEPAGSRPVELQPTESSGQRVPQIGEYRDTGQPSEWFKMVSGQPFLRGVTTPPTNQSASQSGGNSGSGKQLPSGGATAIAIGQRAPQVGEYRDTGQPSEWFKMVSGQPFSSGDAVKTVAVQKIQTGGSPSTGQQFPSGDADRPRRPIRRQSTREKIRDLKARVAKSTSESRRIADAVKASLATDHDCPYCGSPLGSARHADHIHPLDKGGLSTERNMVWVCVKCNLRKHSMTLSAFIKKCGLDRSAVEARLELLGKDY
jgi:5-methylcytosine-specific restriction endonuclease McrA